MESTLSSLSTVYSYYLKNYYRSKSFYLIFILIVVSSVLMVYLSFHYLPKIDALLSSQGPAPAELKEKVVLYLWSYVMSDLPVFAAVFFSSPAISSEIENRTAFHIFALPVDRSILLIGKYLAAASAAMISMAIFVASEIGTAEFLFPGRMIPSVLTSIGMLVLFILAISAFTFLVSSLSLLFLPPSDPALTKVGFAGRAHDGPPTRSSRPARVRRSECAPQVRVALLVRGERRLLRGGRRLVARPMSSDPPMGAGCLWKQGSADGARFLTRGIARCLRRGARSARQRMRRRRGSVGREASTREPGGVRSARWT